jgi:hypothetical protein
VQGIEPSPDQQAEQEQRGQLIEAANEMIGGPPAKDEQSKPAPQIPKQPGAQVVELEGTRGQLRLLRSRWISFSCSVSRTSSARASA